MSRWVKANDAAVRGLLCAQRRRRAYLEAAYRNALLHDRAGLSIPAGHIHTPDIQRFDTDFAGTDATFETWRDAIVAQSRELIAVVGAHS
jgi:hypothetical protein